MTRLTAMLALIALASLSAIPHAAQAQSKAAAREAYCAKKPNPSEREICLDKELTRIDGALNDVYGELRKKLGSTEFKSLRKEQLKWLRERNSCGGNTQCLATKYEDRTAALDQYFESLQNPGKSHVEIGCDGPGQKYVNGECLNTTGSNAVPALGEDAVWHTSSYNDPANKGRFTAILRYGTPETDEVAFEAICTAGSGGDFATTVISYNTGNMREGKNVALNVSTQGYSKKLDGEVYGANVEEGVTGILFRPNYNNPFWEALAHGDALNYKIKGRDAAGLTLNGSGAVVRKFIKACKATTAADTSSSNEPVLSAKNRTCNKWGTIKSERSDTPVTVTFKNRTDGERAVMWIDFKGTPIDYTVLDPGQSYTVKTYITHPWMFTDGPGNCIEMFMPKTGVTVFNITADSPFFGPEHD